MFAVLIVCLMPLFCELKPIDDNLIYNLTDLNGNPYGIVRIKRKSGHPAMSDKMYHSRRYRQKDNLIDSVLPRGDDFEEQESLEELEPSGDSYESPQKRNFRKTKQNIVPQIAQSGSSKRFSGKENDYVKDKSLPDPKKTRSFTDLSKPKKITKETKEVNSMPNKSQIKKNHDLSLTPEKSNTKKKISSKQENKPIATEIKTPLQEKHVRLPDKGESKKVSVRNRSQAVKDPALPGPPNKKSEAKPRRLKEDDVSKTNKSGSGEQKQPSQMKKSIKKSPSDTKQRKALNGNPKLKTM